MRFTPLLILVLGLCAAAPARAQGSEPSAAVSGLPDLELEGTSGATHHLSEYLGRVLVLVYEDKHSSRQNAELKEAMRDRARRTNLASQVTFLPIADLDGYGFFALRPFARSKVRGMAEKFGIEILIDWSGEIARVLGLTAEQSNVLIVNRRGQVVFRQSGALGPRDRDRFFAALDQAVAGTS